MGFEIQKREIYPGYGWPVRYVKRGNGKSICRKDYVGYLFTNGRFYFCDKDEAEINALWWEHAYFPTKEAAEKALEEYLSRITDDERAEIIAQTMFA